MNFLPTMLLATTLIGGGCNIQAVDLNNPEISTLLNSCKESYANCQVFVGTCDDLENILDCLRPSLPNFGNCGDEIETPDVEIPDDEVETPDAEFPGDEGETPDVEFPGDEGETPDVELPDDEVETPDAEFPGDEAETPPDSKPEAPENGSTDAEQEAAKSFVEQVVSLVNVERAKVGLPALTMSEDLNKAAQIRAKETVQSFSHTRPNGSSFSSVLKENGISYRGAGENIAWGQRTPEAVVKAWMNSEGHRANILNKNFTAIGVGYYLNGSTPYWAQLFTY